MKLKKLGLLMIAVVLIVVLAACEGGGSGGTIGDIGGGSGGTSGEVEDELIANIDIDSNLYWVDYGTTGQEVIDSHLPESAQVNFQDNTSGTFDLSWQTPGNYNSENPGDYSFTASIVGLTGAEADVTVRVKELVLLDNNISANTVLTNDKTYRVVSNITVSASLEIEPGTTIQFTEGRRMRFDSGSLINAVGTEDNMILFTGTVKQPGWWDGIQVRNTENPGNIMDYVIIEYGGGDNFESNVEPANLVIGGRITTGRLQLSNSIIRESAGFGLDVRKETNLDGFSNNTITENNLNPIRVKGDVMHFLDSDSDFTGNSIDMILAIAGDSFADATSNDIIDDDMARTWSKLNVPYNIELPWVINNSEISIMPGAEFVFNSNAYFRFFEGSRLIAAGTEEDKILFTGASKSPGSWRGIQIRSLEDNIIDHAIFEYGGNGTFESNLEEVNLIVGGRLAEDNGRLTLTNTELRDSSGFGLEVREDSYINVDFETSNSFSNNLDGDFLIDPDANLN